MKKIKNYLNKIFWGTILSLLTTSIVFAQGGIGQEPPTYTDIDRILTNVRNFVYGILGAIVVIMLIWAGITFVTAEGDPAKAKKARDRLLYAILGIAVGLIAAGAFTIIERFFR